MKYWRKFLWLGGLAGITTALLLVLPASKGESKGGNGATIVATASVRGETSPCG